jgi:hypothetical protein
MVNCRLVGKYLTQWEKFDMIKIKVTNLFKIDGNPCQVADAAFHTQCFKIIDG